MDFRPKRYLIVIYAFCVRYFIILCQLHDWKLIIPGAFCYAPCKFGVLCTGVHYNTFSQRSTNAPDFLLQNSPKLFASDPPSHPLLPPQCWIECRSTCRYLLVNVVNWNLLLFVDEKVLSVKE